MKTKDSYTPPSIGRIGEIYFDERNNRIKYFANGIKDNREEISEDLEKCRQAMQKFNATRINARFLYRGSPITPDLEAHIPLNNGLSDVNLLFFGINHSLRTDPYNVLIEEEGIVKQILSEKRKRHEKVPEGYQIQRLTLDNVALSDAINLVELYREAFPTYTAVLDLNTVSSMIENSIVYGARDSKGIIVSTSVAEISSVPLNHGNFRICELSEMATRRTHRGRGLVTLVTQALSHEIRDSVDLIYAEARACHAPINYSFYNMGFSFGGKLMKQCILSGDHDVTENGPYENLNVWFMLPQEKHE